MFYGSCTWLVALGSSAFFRENTHPFFWQAGQKAGLRWNLCSNSMIYMNLDRSGCRWVKWFEGELLCLSSQGQEYLSVVTVILAASTVKCFNPCVSAVN